MTLSQLESLSEDEVAMCLFVVNVILPLEAPKVEFKPRHLTWFRHDMLIKKLMDASPRIKPEGHAVFTSLMEKMGVKVEIKKIEPIQTETTSSLCSQTTPPNPETPITSSVPPETGSASPSTSIAPESTLT